MTCKIPSEFIIQYTLHYSKRSLWQQIPNIFCQKQEGSNRAKDQSWKDIETMQTTERERGRQLVDVFNPCFHSILIHASINWRPLSFYAGIEEIEYLCGMPVRPSHRDWIFNKTFRFIEWERVCECLKRSVEERVGVFQCEQKWQNFDIWQNLKK